VSPIIGLSKPATRSRSISLSGCSSESQSRNSKSNSQALNMFLASSMEVQRWSLYSLSRDRFKTALRDAASSSSLMIASENSVPRISLITGGGTLDRSLLNRDSDWDIILKRRERNQFLIRGYKDVRILFGFDYEIVWRKLLSNH
jgi:hypothetical protein